MPIFAFQAVSAEGKVVQGSIDAVDRLTAAGRLQQQGLVPLSLRPPGQTGGSKSRIKLPGWGRDLAQHRQVFARTFASLLAAGIPLDRALAINAELTESGLLREALQRGLGSIKGGNSFSTALEAHPQIFPALYVNMVRAGETSGHLAAVFAQLADYQESVNELRNQLLSAMIYPALLVIVGSASVLILMEFVVPRFAVVFEQAGAALPLPTQILLGVSGVLRKTWWLWFLGIPALCALLWNYLRSESGRKRWDHLVLALPKLGSVLERMLVARFARVWGVLLQSGVPMIRSLEVAREVVGNKKIAAAVDRVVQGVKQGKGVARPLADSGAFPPLSVHFVGIGEETGRLDAMLLELANVFEREVRSAVKNLVALFEPVMILLMGLIVGAIVISILLAIFSINEVPL